MSRHYLIMTLLSFFIAQSVYADYVNDTCKQDYQKFDDTDLQVGRFGSEGTCFVSVHYNPNFELRYRDFLMTNEGLLMVFNSFGVGDEASTTGAREFFFPSKVKTNTSVSFKNGIISVVLTDDVTITFSSKTGKILKMTNMNFSLASKVVPSNKGGLEISNSKVVYVDGGFTLGKSPTTVDAGKSYIKKLTQSCQLVNRELFDNSNGEAILRFKNKEFDAFVAQRCPNI